MSDDRALLRRRIGRSAAFWAGPGGVAMHPHGWSAISGAHSVDYNVGFCDGDGDALDDGVDELLRARVPAVMMVAGRSLEEVGRLVSRSWVCIGATPMMVRRLEGEATAVPSEEPSTRVRRLGADDGLAPARALIVEVFGIESELGPTALPAPGADPPSEVWGAFDDDGELRACLALVRIDETVVVWSMATATAARRGGFGRRALEAALHSAASSGARRALLYASPAGEPFYRWLGFEELERWQMWSRPRWVLA